jgi:hypothetical protein
MLTRQTLIPDLTLIDSHCRSLCILISAHIRTRCSLHFLGSGPEIKYLGVKQLISKSEMYYKFVSQTSASVLENLNFQISFMVVLNTLNELLLGIGSVPRHTP